ncbi:MAG TPA: DUF790 family protein [Polyangiaceae bacterium]
MPRYLTEADHVWLDVLLAECARYVGRKRAELDDRLKEPLGVPAPEDKLKVAGRVLLREYEDRTQAPVSPAVIRDALFAARAREATRAAALSSASIQLKIDSSQVEEFLLADLPPQRRLAPLKHALSSTELALRANHAIVASLLRRATMVRIEAEGDVRALVRAVKLRGLLCLAEPRSGRSVLLSVSGPYALFRHTLVYGRALASLVSRAARCRRFSLHATCVLSGARDLVEFTVKSGDPVVPTAAGPAYDSKLEERFAKDFGKRALDWELVREPEAIAVGANWIFPDFLLRHRRDSARHALLEIVGFWTPEYLRHKLESLRKANLNRFILCVDAARNCAPADFPAHANVIRYKRRVPAAEVLKVLEQL